ncbi:N/A [soil metagenome]
MKKRRSAEGFTLIELLVVITIIAILASLVLSVAGIVQQKAARARAEAEIKAMEAGLESYKADNGDYPTGTNLTTSSSGNNAFLFNALNGTNGSGKVYVEFQKNQTNSSGYIIDPFGNSYGYQYPGATNRSGTNFPDLFSVANSSNNSNAWIKNW